MLVSVESTGTAALSWTGCFSGCHPTKELVRWTSEAYLKVAECQRKAAGELCLASGNRRGAVQAKFSFGRNGEIDMLTMPPRDPVTMGPMLCYAPHAVSDRLEPV
jgi:hypothetical protein